MFLDRADNRKEIQKAYRSELKQEIDSKKSRVVNNKAAYHPQNETFSLIANIQKEQENRKKTNQEYYDQLREQIQIEKQAKLRVQQERKRKELQEDEKIKRDNEMLKQRYEQEKRKEQKKGRTQLEPLNDKKNESYSPQEANLKKKQRFRDIRQENRKEELNEPLDKLTKQQNIFKQTEEDFQQLKIKLNYATAKIDNEQANYIGTRSYKNNYYKELLGEKRKMEDEARQIYEFNRYLNIEKYKKKQQNLVLEELRSFQKVQEEKNSQFMSLNFRNKRLYSDISGLLSKPEQKKQIKRYQRPKQIKDQWRKLD